MSGKIPSIEEVFRKFYKRQCYLGIRMFILSLLIIFTYNPVFETENVDKTLFLNTTLMLALPILIDYCFGFDTYSSLTNASRWVGFFISGIIVACCFISYMGGINFLFESEFLGGFSIFGWEIDIFYWKLFIWILPFIAIFDWIFSLSPREVEFYKLHNKLDKDILESLQKAKEELKFSERVEKEKQKILQIVPKEE